VEINLAREVAYSRSCLVRPDSFTGIAAGVSVADKLPLSAVLLRKREEQRSRVPRIVHIQVFMYRPMRRIDGIDEATRFGEEGGSPE